MHYQPSSLDIKSFVPLIALGRPKEMAIVSIGAHLKNVYNLL